MNTLKWNQIFVTLICLTLMLVLTIGNVNASPKQQSEMDFAAIDAYVTEQMNNLGIPGMALAIVQGDQIVHLQGFGVADSSGRKVTPQTPFYIASVTKSFTALAVMQLVEAGKIDLDAPVQTYLPWFELADKEASAKITVRNLLNQTTGITRADGEHEWTRQGLDEIVRGLKTVQLTQPVGTTFQYSNLNYIFAGLIVEQVSGQSYADYVTEHIFEPLDMHHSYASRAPALTDGLSEGHRYMFGFAFVERDESPHGVASGGLIVSVEDMSHYAIAHLNDGRYTDTSILSPQGVAELHTAPILVNEGEYHYAMGWDVSTLNGIPSIEHIGALGNFSSAAVLLPDKGWGVVLLANINGFEQLMQLGEVAKGVVDVLNGNPPVSVTAPWYLRFLYWTVLLMPLLMFLGIVYSWRYWWGKGIGHILLIVILYGGAAWLCLFGVPQVIGSPSPWAIRIVYPELAYSLIAGAALGIGWSVIYTVMNLMARRST